YIKKHTGRAHVIYLKDFLLAGHKPMHMYDLLELGSFEFRPLGAGQQDIVDLVNTSAQAGTSWVVH
ncbi:MAG TPA: sugar phosphate isomerase/epimerase, partial [Ruminococcaceae bacterium]|nr:sugar phosphate isomerase/epimerase [Oscillospiraceae bacterium]